MTSTTDYSHATHVAVAPGESYGGYYGRGFTVEEAKVNLKKEGGRLTRYLVYRLPEGAINAYVDDWGSIAWTWDESAPDKEAKGEIVFKRGT